uniref:SCP domain-containing protein n=1 Tax=Mesocestoides corti TaxID=53468 RepID=A0A5K3FZX1_MESCO
MRRVIYFVALIWCAVADIPTEDQRTQVVEFFTNLRESVDPPASNMMLMRYSLELETKAQNFLDICSSTGLDRNILPKDAIQFGGYVDQRGLAYVDMLNYYASERQYYNYDQNRCTRSCSVYKEMVLATSTAVGCAKGKCNPRGVSSNRNLTICLLKKTEWNPEERPYRRGDSCSECPDGFDCQRK